MLFNLDFRSGKPIYVQIVEHIKYLIASGELKPGDQLPPVRELAADLQISFNTTARAYRILDEAGILSTQHGRGTYILDPSSARESERLRSESLETLTKDYLTAARHLNYSPEEISTAFERHLIKHQESDNNYF
ncbi:MAG: GntR family transcriptional regulator [Anaerolineales bacterium]|nr:GntR family transcriptional regulator [Anaerolineales bacterium]